MTERFGVRQLVVDERSGTHTRTDVALGCEVLEREHRGESRNTEIICQCSRRWQPVTWRDHSSQDCSSHALVDLELQGFASLWIKLNEHRAVLLTNLQERFHAAARYAGVVYRWPRKVDLWTRRNISYAAIHLEQSGKDPRENFDRCSVVAEFHLV